MKKEDLIKRLEEIIKELKEDVWERRSKDQPNQHSGAAIEQEVRPLPYLESYES